VGHTATFRAPSSPQDLDTQAIEAQSRRQAAEAIMVAVGAGPHAEAHRGGAPSTREPSFSMEATAAPTNDLLLKSHWRLLTVRAGVIEDIRFLKAYLKPCPAASSGPLYAPPRDQTPPRWANMVAQEPLVPHSIPESAVTPQYMQGPAVVPAPLLEAQATACQRPDGYAMQIHQATEDAVAEIVSHIEPSAPSNAAIQVRALHVSQLVEHPLTVIGSCASSTYLPSSTLDLCACFSSPETGWDHEAGIAFLGKAYSALCEAAAANPAEVSNVTWVDARVKLVKAIVCGGPIVLCTNQANAFAAVEFVRVVDSFTHHHMLTRSILFIKAWLQYESLAVFGTSIMDSSQGGLSAYALQTMVISVFNMQSVASPLHALLLFAHTFVGMDWRRFCVSVQGLVESETGHCLTSATGAALIPPSLLLDVQAQVRANRTWSPASFRHATVNVIDPLVNTNNLGISISSLALQRLEAILLAVKVFDWQGSQSPQYLKETWQEWQATMAVSGSMEAFPPL